MSEREDVTAVSTERIYSWLSQLGTVAYWRWRGYAVASNGRALLMVPGYVELPDLEESKDPVAVRVCSSLETFSVEAPPEDALTRSTDELLAWCEVRDWTNPEDCSDCGGAEKTNCDCGGEPVPCVCPYCDDNHDRDCDDCDGSGTIPCEMCGPVEEQPIAYELILGKPFNRNLVANFVRYWPAGDEVRVWLPEDERAAFHGRSGWRLTVMGVRATDEELRGARSL